MCYQPTRELLSGNLELATLRQCSNSRFAMEAYAVNRAVNSVEDDNEECIEPAAG